MGKPLSTGFILTLAGAAVAGGLVATNPPESAYEQYAVTRLTAYLNDHLCRELPPGLGLMLERQCQQMLEANQGSMQTMVQQNTVTQNYGLFSLYHTTLVVPGLDLLPTYRVSTVGIFSTFITYHSEKL